MSNRQGFSLIEVVVIMIIIGVMAAVAIPNFINSIEQTKAHTAENNLLAISAAQQKYFEDYNVYCTATTGNPNPCDDNFNDLNTYLHLSMSTSDLFTYNCTVLGASYNCTASDGTVTLTLTPNAQPPVSCTVGGKYCPQ